MDKKSYTYKTPTYAKDSMGKPGTCPEFSEEAARIITYYVRKYAPKVIPTALTELHIRDLLSNEHMLRRKLDPLVRDYLIKVFLSIIEPKEAYERKVLRLFDNVLH